MRSLNDQLNNEELMLNLGQNRVRSNQNKKQSKGMESLTIYGEALCSFNVDIIVNHLRAIRRKIEKGKAGINYAMLTPLLELPLSIMKFSTLVVPASHSIMLICGEEIG